MNAVVAADKNWGIGKNGDLLVHLPGDLKHFKELTMGKVLIMGRKTYESLPKRPLEGRSTLILTSAQDYDPGFQNTDDTRVFVCHDMRDLWAIIMTLSEFEDVLPGDVFVCGGGSVYEQMYDYCTDFHVTRIDTEFDADTFFPNLDERGAELTYQSERHEENGCVYHFLLYKKEASKTAE